MGNRWGNSGKTVSDFIFGGSKITVDGDCSHEIKRCLVLGRKVMTNLDSILKSRHHFLWLGQHLLSCKGVWQCIAKSITHQIFFFAFLGPAILCGRCKMWAGAGVEQWFLFKTSCSSIGGFLGGTVVKNPPVNVGDIRDKFDPWVGKFP